MTPTRYVEPESIRDACNALREDPEAKAVAGGTAVVLMMRQGLLEPTVLVSLGRLRSLNYIKEREGLLEIGACTPLQDVADARLVRERAPSLARACAQVANIRVRNVATLGGNVAEADYASDPPPVLVSLGAVIVTTDGTKSRRVPAADFIADFYTTVLSEGELVTAIEVPLPKNRSSRYVKFRTRSSEDRPCVGVAASMDRDDTGAVVSAEVVIGAVAATPQRFPQVVQAAVENGFDRAAIAAVANAYSDRVRPLSDARGSAWYRKQVVEVLVRRALEDLTSSRLGR